MLGAPLFLHCAGANTLPLNDASGAARMGNLEGIDVATNGIRLGG